MLAVSSARSHTQVPRPPATHSPCCSSSNATPLCLAGANQLPDGLQHRVAVLVGLRHRLSGVPGNSRQPRGGKLPTPTLPPLPDRPRRAHCDGGVPSAAMPAGLGVVGAAAGGGAVVWLGCVRGAACGEQLAAAAAGGVGCASTQRSNEVRPHTLPLAFLRPSTSGASFLDWHPNHCRPGRAAFAGLKGHQAATLHATVRLPARSENSLLNHRRICLGGSRCGVGRTTH